MCASQMAWHVSVRKLMNPLATTAQGGVCLMAFPM